MIYHSTRNKALSVNSRQAVLKGLSDDGGLFVSDALFDKPLFVKDILSGSYENTAFEVFRRLLDDFLDEELKDGIAKAYTGTFAAPDVTPVTPIGGDWLLELYHGPTCAFKDVALLMLPRLMSSALKSADRRLMIVTATSGDTGKAALNGFKDVPGIAITVFYPDQKVSDVQRLQMVTQEGRNVAVSAVKGNFDDVQSAVKRLFASCSGRVFSEPDVNLSSANSINIGRLVPQVTYYYEAYRKLVLNGTVQNGDEVDFCVPTGNFGDVLAGYFAKSLGLPVGKLVVASNANNVLTDFINTGVYNRMRPFVKTISPSMDILVSSNLERMLYYASGMDDMRVAGFMRDLSEKGSYKADPKTFETISCIFDCGWADDATTKAVIRRAWEDDKRLIDTHTAVAYSVAGEKKRPGVPMVILSTASPFKFSKDVYEALTGDVQEGRDGFWYMSSLSAFTGIKAPAALSGLAQKKVLHGGVIAVGDMPAFVMRAARSGNF